MRWARVGAVVARVMAKYRGWDRDRFRVGYKDVFEASCD